MPGTRWVVLELTATSAQRQLFGRCRVSSQSLKQNILTSKGWFHERTPGNATHRSSRMLVSRNTIGKLFQRIHNGFE